MLLVGELCGTELQSLAFCICSYLSFQQHQIGNSGSKVVKVSQR